jgi:hypothetical protein
MAFRGAQSQCRLRLGTPREESAVQQYLGGLIAPFYSNSSTGSSSQARSSRALRHYRGAQVALPSGAGMVVPAETGIMCLQSAPVDKDGDIELMDNLKVYLQ